MCEDMLLKCTRKATVLRNSDTNFINEFLRMEHPFKMVKGVHQRQLISATIAANSDYVFVLVIYDEWKEDVDEEQYDWLHNESTDHPEIN